MVLSILINEKKLTLRHTFMALAKCNITIPLGSKLSKGVVGILVIFVDILSFDVLETSFRGVALYFDSNIHESD